MDLFQRQEVQGPGSFEPCLCMDACALAWGEEGKITDGQLTERRKAD